MGVLNKGIGFWSATAIAVGSMIGSGVFMKPAAMAAQLGSPLWLAAVWVIAGIFSLLGALVFAELGAMLPETGGAYIYFRYMFGKFVAFLYGWAAFAVINTASLAAIAFVCAQYADYFLQLPHFSAAIEQSVQWHIPFIGNLYPLANFGVKMLAVSLVTVLALLNYASTKAGSAFQVLSTAIKILVIGALIAGIFLSGKGSVHHFTAALHPKAGVDLLNGIVMAMTGAFFAYDGWINISFVAGEIKDPQKNIPRSLWVAVVACILVYTLINQAYLYALPIEQVAASSLVAADAFAVAFGQAGSAVIAALIVICTLGAINGNILASARVTYAMGKDKVFFPWTGNTHRKFGTPGNALLLHGIWTCIFIISGSFDMLADMFIFITWIAYLFGAVGIFLLRRKMPHTERPYKIWGFPFTPVIFILFSAFYLTSTIWSDVQNYLTGKAPVINSLLGLLITALGIPLFFYYRKKTTTSGKQESI